jgi:hypothetical protein
VLSVHTSFDPPIEPKPADGAPEPAVANAANAAEQLTSAAGPSAKAD